MQDQKPLPRMSMAVLFLLLLAGCVEATKAQLLGHWRYVDAQSSANYVFREDGTYSGDVWLSGRLVWQGGGQWTLRNNVISYHEIRAANSKNPVMPASPDKLIAITRDYFIIETQKGNRHKYMKVP